MSLPLDVTEDHFTDRSMSTDPCPGECCGQPCLYVEGHGGHCECTDITTDNQVTPCAWCNVPSETEKHGRWDVCSTCKLLMEKLTTKRVAVGNPSKWRERSLEVICKVMNDNPTAGPAELRKLLRAAYPFGQRKYHPYKIWCEEQRNAIETRM